MRDLPQNFVEGESKGLRSRAPSAADVVRQTVFPRFIAAFSAAKYRGSQIGRASCRERVCLYV